MNPTPKTQLPKPNSTNMDQQEFTEGKDYYFNEEGFLVLTERFLKERGYCCGMGCLHCPYKESGKDTGKDFKTTTESSEDDLHKSG